MQRSLNWGNFFLFFFGKYRRLKYEMAIVHGHCGESAASRMGDQLDTIFIYTEIMYNRIFEGVGAASHLARAPNNG